MSTPDAGERLLAEASARRAAATRMLSWSGVGGHRLEAARVVLGERSLRASGSLVSAPQDDLDPYAVQYSLSTDELGALRRLVVRVVRADGEQHVTVNRSEEGIWLVDNGEGAERTDFDGALDIDLAYSPLFNALPVRRLGLHRTAGEHDLPMVFVGLPGLGVQQVAQGYRTLSVGEPAGESSVVSFTSGEFQADITVDGDGLVLDYPGLARRASRPDAG